MNIVLQNTIYSLFIYLLLQKDWKEDLYLVDDERLYTLLKDKVEVFHILQASIKDNPWKYYKGKWEFYRFLKEHHAFLNPEIPVYGDAQLFIHLFAKRKMYVIEDGLFDYNRKYNESFRDNWRSTIKSILKLENLRYKATFMGSWADRVYLTGVAPIPKEIAPLVREISLAKLWSEKTELEQQEILQLFGFSLEKVERYQKKRQILFTQPLSEDRIITEAEKIAIYKKVIAQYKEEDLVIKVHPREKTKYKELFPNIEIMDEMFPSELLSILGISFEKSITLFSTAALHMNEVEAIDWYGTAVHKNIAKVFGSMEDIMTVNAWIGE